MKVTGFILILLIPLNLPAQVEARQVTIESADKFLLKAKYYSSGKTGPGILLLHQCDRRGPLTGYEQLAERLTREGFNVLVPDSRGFGESRDEQYQDFHSQMSLIEPKVPQDVEAVYNFLSSRKEVDKTKVGLAGASCGVRQAIRLAATRPEVRALVFISGSYSPTGPIAEVYNKLTNIPVLSMYSERDRFGTPAAMRDSFERSKNEYSKLLVYKGDGHGTPLLTQDKNLEQEIVMWFVTHLR
jgi:dienelactone hydrolase